MASLNDILKVNKKNVKTDVGIVYLLIIKIEDEEFIKVGLTTRTVIDRMCEIATSCWKWYKYMPYIYSKRYRTTTDIYKKEKVILDALSEYRSEPKKPVQGHTEMFKIDLGVAVEVYEKVLEGKELDKSIGVCKVCGKQKKFNGKCGHDCEKEKQCEE